MMTLKPLLIFCSLKLYMAIFVQHNPFVYLKGRIPRKSFSYRKLAEEHNPEFRLVTNNIAEVYQRIAGSYPKLLHPNLSKISMPSCGAKEFANTDKQLGVIIQEW